MTDPSNYNKYVVVGGHYKSTLLRRTHARQTRSTWLFTPNDCPDKWNMENAGTRNGSRDTFWNVGYIHRYKHSRDHHLKYWWCRYGDWIPLWDKSTKQRRDLMIEIRTFWVNKIILETTPLPEDIVSMLPEYLEDQKKN